MMIKLQHFETSALSQKQSKSDHKI